MTDTAFDHGGVPPGLCANCRHARRVPSGRGSVFWLCERSRTDARFPRYPRLPVVRCAGYEVAPGVERDRWTLPD